MNIRSILYWLHNAQCAASANPSPPGLRRAWKLGLMLPILLPVALAWWHQKAPAYLLTDLGVPPIRAADRAFSFGSPVKVEYRGKFYGYTNAAGQAAWSEYRGRGANVSIRACFTHQGKTLDLGTLGGTNCLVTGLSASGQVIGASYTQAGEQHAFLWKEGKMTDLGTLPGGQQSQANALNDREEIVGTAQMETGDFHAFFWREGRMTDLGLLSRGTESFALALNNRGEIVGWALTENGSSHAVVWKQGKIHDLNRLVASPAGLVLDMATAVDAQGRIRAEGLLNGQRHLFRLTPSGNKRLST